MILNSGCTLESSREIFKMLSPYLRIVESEILGVVPGIIFLKSSQGDSNVQPELLSHTEMRKIP